MKKEKLNYLLMKAENQYMKHVLYNSICVYFIEI